jgi:hypothetical protein
MTAATQHTPLGDAITDVIRQINSYCDTGNIVTLSYVRRGIRGIQADYGPVGVGAAHALLSLCRSVQRIKNPAEEEDE